MTLELGLWGFGILTSPEATSHFKGRVAALASGSDSVPGSRNEKNYAQLGIIHFSGAFYSPGSKSPVPNMVTKRETPGFRRPDLPSPTPAAGERNGGRPPRPRERASPVQRAAGDDHRPVGRLLPVLHRAPLQLPPGAQHLPVWGTAHRGLRASTVRPWPNKSLMY